MATPQFPTSSPADAIWQHRLRRSVRLHLALHDPNLDTVAVEARLRLVERHLVRHLLRGQPLTLIATAKANRAVQLAQEALLKSELEIAAILEEWPAQRAIEPLRWAVQYAGGWLPAVD